MPPRTAVIIFLALPMIGCDPESPPPPEIAEPAKEVIAFTGANIWDGTGNPVVENAVLLVRDGRVVELRTGAAPAGSNAVSLRGKWIVPGFVNSHGHVSGRWAPDDVTDPSGKIAADLALYAHYGVTTVLSLGDEPAEAFVLRDQQDDDTGPRQARLHLAGKVITASNPDDAVTETAENVAAGVDWLKIRVDDNLGTAAKMPWPAVEAVLAAGAEAGVPVATHLFYLEDAMRLLEAGSNLIAHSVRDKPVGKPFIDAMLEAGVCYVPTLAREVSTFVYAERPEFFEDPFFLEAADSEEMKRVTQPEHTAEVAASPAAAAYKKALVQAQENLKILSDAGVPIAFGTDSGPPGRFPGYFEHMEFSLMTDAGLTPEQALLSATSVAADCLGLGDVGTLEEGKWADFLVLAENPLVDIGATKSLQQVYIAGNEVSRR